MLKLEMELANQMRIPNPRAKIDWSSNSARNKATCLKGEENLQLQLMRKFLEFRTHWTLQSRARSTNLVIPTAVVLESKIK